MKSTKLLILLSIISSGCATIQRPDVDVGIVNAPGKRVKSYNLKEDYREDGSLKPGAEPTYYPANSVQDLNKWFCLTSPAGPEEGLARFKAYLAKLRAEYQNGCKPPN